MTEFLLHLRECDRVKAAFGIHPKAQRHFICADSVLKMDVVCLYVMLSSNHRLCTQHFFPSCMHSKYLEIIPITETICFRPQALFLFIDQMNYIDCSIIAVEKDPPTSVVLIPISGNVDSLMLLF